MICSGVYRLRLLPTSLSQVQNKPDPLNPPGPLSPRQASYSVDGYAGPTGFSLAEKSDNINDIILRRIPTRMHGRESCPIGRLDEECLRWYPPTHCCLFHVSFRVLRQRLRQALGQDPAVEGAVVDLKAALQEHPLDVPIAERVAQVP
jgi:hypothetical protein